MYAVGSVRRDAGRRVGRARRRVRPSTPADFEVQCASPHVAQTRQGGHGSWMQQQRQVFECMNPG